MGLSRLLSNERDTTKCRAALENLVRKSRSDWRYKFWVCALLCVPFPHFHFFEKHFSHSFHFQISRLAHPSMRRRMWSKLEEYIFSWVIYFTFSEEFVVVLKLFVIIAWWLWNESFLLESCFSCQLAQLECLCEDEKKGMTWIYLFHIESSLEKRISRAAIEREKRDMKFHTSQEGQKSGMNRRDIWYEYLIKTLR